MDVTSERFVGEAHEALGRPRLQETLKLLRFGSGLGRMRVRRELPEFDTLRDEAVAIKDHVLAHLDRYLEIFIAKAAEAGTKIHWAADGAAARDIILKICQEKGARTVTKSKSMISEEIELAAHLSAHGIRPVETDLGEYIVQLRGERPSHIIGPALHLTRHEVADTFRRHHQGLDPARVIDTPAALVAEARVMLREAFLSADVGISGANFLVAETGSIALVTNEGNAELTTTLPRTHIVLASIEKIVPTLEDCATLLRVLVRSATAQDFPTYNSFITGPRRGADADGPEDMHIVLLDNGRSAILGTPMQDMLRCLRCGACLNNCPVYASVGGHSYGSVYAGPMGAVLTPMLSSIEAAGHLPNASTFCGKCEEVCPVRIPLPRLMRHWREREFEKHLAPATMRSGLSIWGWLAERPHLHRAVTALTRFALRRWRKGAFIERLPLIGSGWTGARDLRAPPARGFLSTFQDGEGRG